MHLAPGAAALDVDDLSDDPHGLVVRIRSSKTDQQGAGDNVGIVYAQRRDLCPVNAVHSWLDALAVALQINNLTGPLMVAVTR